MRYLKLQRTRIILLAFLVSALLLVVFPEVDLRISRLFFDGRFYLADAGWTSLMQQIASCFVVLSMAAVFTVYFVNKLLKQNLWGVDARRVLYLILVLALGAGLIVNVAFKDNFGRARPRNIEEFGGTERFTPAFVIAQGCQRNCSFSSGDGAAAFFSLALTMTLSRRRMVVAAAVGFGFLVSFARIAVGAHFFSDTVVSFFVMWIVADALHHYMRLPSPELVERRVRRNAVILTASARNESL